MSAAGDIVVHGPIDVRSGGPEYSAEADFQSDYGGVTLAGRMKLAGGDYGGQLRVWAAKDIRLEGSVTARGHGVYGSAGEVDLSASGSSIVTARRIDLSWPAATSYGNGGLSIYGGAVLLRSRVLARGSYENVISFQESLDVTGATLLADQFSRNEIRCPCVDGDGDSTCDGQCLVPVQGLDQANFAPPPLFVPP